MLCAGSVPSTAIAVRAISAEGLPATSSFLQPVQASIDRLRSWVYAIPGATFELQKERFGPPTGAPMWP